MCSLVFGLVGMCTDLYCLDQLILQLIQLMDELLKKENLDLKLTPYRAMATSTKVSTIPPEQPLSTCSLSSALETNNKPIFTLLCGVA